MSTIQHIESFNLVGSNADLLLSGYDIAEGVIVPSGGRFGDTGYNLTVNNQNLLAKRFDFQPFTTTSFYYYQDSAVLSLANVYVITHLVSINYSATNISVGIQLNANGSLSIQGQFGTVKGTSSVGVILPQTWHHIELRSNLASSGSASLVVDGIEVLDITGQNFLRATNGCVMTFIGDNGVNKFDAIVYQDDPSALPALLGDHRIHTLLPSANTAQADWTGSFTDIDDPVGSDDGDTTFISATTLNNKSEFELGNLTESPTVIHAVKSTITARKTDAGTKGVTHHIDSNGAEEAGAEFAAAETYAPHSAIHELDPDGSVAWTEAAVNALKVGVEITT